MNSILKNFFLLCVAFVTTTAFAACGDDDDDQGGGATVSELKLTQTSLAFTSTGGEQTFSVQAPEQVQVSADQPWCTATAGTMSANLKVTPVTVSVQPNTTTADRTATITVSAAGQRATVSVTQAAGDWLEVPEQQFSVSAGDETVTVGYRASASVDVQSGASWIRPLSNNSARTEENGKTVVTGSAVFDVDANTGAERQGTATLTLGSIVVTVTITQAAFKADPISATAMQVASQMYPGWNLGNTLEPPLAGLAAETSWQPTKTMQQVIDYVRSLGFRSVRIPCSWNCHMTNGQIDPQWTARVREVVDYCINDGLYVVLNDHWDNGWIETNGFTDLSESNVSAKLDALKNMWTQIATAFSAYDEHLLFAGLNEPNCDSQAKTDVLLRYEQAFIDAVRATGGNNASRILVVQGPSTDIEKTDSYYSVTRLSDTAADKLMVEVHYYTPWNLCGMERDESWGKMFFYWGSGNHLSGSAYNASWGEEASLKSLFQRMKKKFVDKGIPVYIGEYGCQWRDVSALSGESQARHDASVEAFHREVCQQAVSMGMVPVVWDINYTNQSGTKGVMTVVSRAYNAVYCQPAMNGITAGVAAAVWPQ